MTRLRVGYPAGAASASVPLAVRIFRERFPSVALDTVVGQAGAHLAALAARQLDVAFVRLAGANGDNLAFRPLHREPVHVAIPELHPLARLRAVRAGHLANEPIVLFPRALDPPLHDHLVHDVLAGCGVAPSVVLEATTLESSLVAVAGGLGIAFAAESAAGQFTVRGVEFRPLVTVAPPLQFGVSWRRGHHLEGRPAVPRRGLRAGLGDQAGHPQRCGHVGFPTACRSWLAVGRSA